MGNRPHLSAPKNRSKDEDIEILRIIDGRYVWYPEARKIEFYPKGVRVSSRTIPLDHHNNTHEGALRVAARSLLANIKDKG